MWIYAVQYDGHGLDQRYPNTTIRFHPSLFHHRSYMSGFGSFLLAGYFMLITDLGQKP
jgi:hypothetical protein